MLTISIAVGLTLLASSTFAQEPDGSAGQGNENPVDSEQPAVRNRVYFTNTSSYSVNYPLGRFGLADKDTNTITSFIEKPRSSCDKDRLQRTIETKTLPPSLAYYNLAQKDYKGSLSFFTSNAEMEDSDRQQLTLTDIATSDLDPNCELSNDKVYEIARRLHGAAGHRVFWVSGVTLSNLNKQVFKKQKWSATVEAGSWLGVGAEGYKGSERIDAVPVMSLRGIFVDVPGGQGSSSGPSTMATSPPNAGRFQGLSDLGLSEEGVNYVIRMEE